MYVLGMTTRGEQKERKKAASPIRFSSSDISDVRRGNFITSWALFTFFLANLPFAVSSRKVSPGDACLWNIGGVIFFPYRTSGLSKKEKKLEKLIFYSSRITRAKSLLSSSYTLIQRDAFTGYAFFLLFLFYNLMNATFKKRKFTLQGLR